MVNAMTINYTVLKGHWCGLCVLLRGANACRSHASDDAPSLGVIPVPALASHLRRDVQIMRWLQSAAPV